MYSACFGLFVLTATEPSAVLLEHVKQDLCKAADASMLELILYSSAVSDWMDIISYASSLLPECLKHV